MAYKKRDELLKEIDQLKAQLEAAEANNLQLSTTLKKIRSKMKGAQRKFKKVKKDVFSLMQASDALIVENDELREKCELKDNLILFLKAQLNSSRAAHEAEVTGLSTELAEGLGLEVSVETS